MDLVSFLFKYIKLCTCIDIVRSKSGKSNLMDAVSFVVGVSTAQLRGTKIADFRSHIGTATDAPTSVTLHYHAPRQQGERTPSETLFTRTITSRDTNEWRVDGKKVNDILLLDRCKVLRISDFSS